MPAQPTWFPRLPAILADLRALPAVPYLNRQALERLFHLQDRRARVRRSAFNMGAAAAPKTSPSGGS